MDSLRATLSATDAAYHDTVIDQDIGNLEDTGGAATDAQLDAILNSVSPLPQLGAVGAPPPPPPPPPPLEPVPQPEEALGDEPTPEHELEEIHMWTPSLLRSEADAQLVDSEQRAAAYPTTWETPSVDDLLFRVARYSVRMFSTD